MLIWQCALVGVKTTNLNNIAVSPSISIIQDSTKSPFLEPYGYIIAVTSFQRIKNDMEFEINIANWSIIDLLTNYIAKETGMTEFKISLRPNMQYLVRFHDQNEYMLFKLTYG
jgi:hypothetical protein